MLTSFQNRDIEYLPWKLWMNSFPNKMNFKQLSCIFLLTHKTFLVNRFYQIQISNIFKFRLLTIYKKWIQMIIHYNLTEDEYWIKLFLAAWLNTNIDYIHYPNIEYLYSNISYSVAKIWIFDYSNIFMLQCFLHILVSAAFVHPLVFAFFLSHLILLNYAGF